jgi:hypothetical protein
LTRSSRLREVAVEGCGASSPGVLSREPFISRTPADDRT